MTAAHDRANRAVQFFERCLTHVKGPKAGQPLTLGVWEPFIRDIFGPVGDDGYRIIRTAFAATPKKQGKTTVGAGVALYLLVADGEAGAEVYSAAADRDQARLVFSIACAMVRASPTLSRICKVMRGTITVPSTESAYTALSSDTRKHHGYNASGIIFDELHTQKNRDLWDTLTLGVAARRQPLTFVMTTAGHDRETICYEQWQYARDVAAGRIEDASFLPLLYETDPAADWDNPELWRSVNINVDESVQMSYLEEKARKARRSLSEQNAFRRYHLNQWTSAETAFLSMRDWDAAAGEAPNLDGLACYGGLDLASTQDMNALSLVFPMADGYYAVRLYVWLPAASIEERAIRDGAPYVEWADAGHIRLTPGAAAATNYGIIRRDIVELAQRYDIRDIGFDTWNAIETANQLQDEGLDLVIFGQGFRSMNAPTKALEHLVITGKLIHDHNPVLRRAAEACEVKQDEAGNQKPVKQKRTDRIDPLVATIMALGRCLENLNDLGTTTADDLLTTSDRHHGSPNPKRTNRMD